MEIRPEAQSDYDTIHALTKTAFAPMAFSDGTEADCIDKLRADGDLVISLVAIDGSKLVGHVAFSPVYIDEASSGWFALGPVSVWPEFQKTGIGSALINEGLAQLKQRSVPGCVLIGDPKYYCRFGFIGDGRLSYRELPKEFVQWISFGDVRPRGALRFSPGLE